MEFSLLHGKKYVSNKRHGKNAIKKRPLRRRSWKRVTKTEQIRRKEKEGLECKHALRMNKKGLCRGEEKVPGNYITIKISAAFRVYKLLSCRDLFNELMGAFKLSLSSTERLSSAQTSADSRGRNFKVAVEMSLEAEFFRTLSAPLKFPGCGSNRPSARTK